MNVQALKWEPSVNDPNRGLVIWAVPENIEITVTLFRDARVTEFEDKEWTFVIEDVRFGAHNCTLSFLRSYEICW